MEAMAYIAHRRWNGAHLFGRRAAKNLRRTIDMVALDRGSVTSLDALSAK